MFYRQSLIQGALLILASELMFATMGAAVKGASTGLPTEVLVFMRNAVGWLVVLPIVWRSGGRRLLITAVPHLHLLRAVAGVSAMYCFFYALGHLHLANGLLLKMTAPLFMPLIGWLWLREQAGWLATLAVPLGFGGVILVLDAGGGASGGTSTAALVGLLGGLLAAVAKLSVRRLTYSEPATRIVFYFSSLALLVSSVPLIWAWQAPTLHEWGLLLLVGAAGTAGQFLLTRGYAAAPAARVSPFGYFSVVYGALYGYLFWGETLTLVFWGGAVLIALAGAMALTGRATARPTVDLALP